MRQGHSAGAVSHALAAPPRGARSLAAPARVDSCEYKGHSATRLANGTVQLIIVPALGGRVVQACCLGHSYLHVNGDLVRRRPRDTDVGADWDDYGGDKVWLAPQGADDGAHWPGPPDRTIDGAEWEATATAEGDACTVRLTSNECAARWGVSLAREITLRTAESRVLHRVTMRNVIGRPVRWAVWDHAQLGAQLDVHPYYNRHLVAYARPETAADGDRFTLLHGDARAGAWRYSPDDGLVEGRYRYELSKAGVRCSSGWACVLNGRDRMAFTQLFDYDRKAEYPHHGSSVAYWSHGPGRFAPFAETYRCPVDMNAMPAYMTAETFGPQVTLQPGESHTFGFAWGLGRAYGRPYAATPKGLVTGATARREGDAVRVLAALTPFVPGRIVCVALDRDGAPRVERDLALAAAGRRSVLDVRLAAPDASHVAIGLRLDGQDAPAHIAVLPVTDEA